MTTPSFRKSRYAGDGISLTSLFLTKKKDVISLTGLIIRNAEAWYLNNRFIPNRIERMESHSLVLSLQHSKDYLTVVFRTLWDFTTQFLPNCHIFL